MAAPATAGGYSPAQLQSAYNIASAAASAGVGQRVYVVDAYNNPNAESDLQVYRSQFGLPECSTANGCFQKLNQNGATSPLPTANASWAGEEALDLDMVSAICPNCAITLIEANDAGSNLYTAVKTAVSLGAKFVSMSFGSAEYSGENYYDSYAFGTPGVVFTASTGDNGYGTSYPATSPNVVAVGGTSLTSAANARGWTETAWSGAGAGCSAYESQPVFQNGEIVSTCHNRGDSDVSAVADPYTGVAVYLTYGGSGWTVYGGTSASAPMIAATYALAGTPAATDYPASYLYLRSMTGFNDVTSGNDGSCSGSALCTAITGWDGPTGLGTPKGLTAFTTPNPNTLTLTNPGDQGIGLNESASLQLQVTDSDPTAVKKFTAVGLPTGLTINASTGLISGKATKLGNYSVAVRASDDSGASASAAFTWKVSTLGGSITVSGEKAIPGLGSVVTLTPDIPGSDTLTKVVWHPSRSDCSVTDSNGDKVAVTATTVTVTCSATSAKTTNISASLTDSAGAVKTVTGVMPFDTSVGTRSVTMQASVDSQQVPNVTPTVCTGRRAALTVTATDTATGKPIKGLAAYVTGKSPTATTASVVTKPLTNVTGQASALATMVANSTYSINTLAQTVYKATAPVTTTVIPKTCTPVLSSTAISSSNAWYGDIITVTGELTRDSGNAYGQVPVAAAAVPVTLTPPATGGTAARTIQVARATTPSDGTPTFSTTFKATASGDVKIAIPSGSGLSAVGSDLGNLTVKIPTTAITATASTTDTGYGSPINVSGSLTMHKDSDAPLASATVSVTVLLPGAKTPTRIASGRTDANGNYSINTTLTKSGTLAVTYAGAPGLPAATATVGTVTAGTWTPALTLNASATNVIAGTLVTFTGAVTRTYNGDTGPASRVPVRLYVTPTSGVPVLLGSATTSTTGTFTMKVAPKVSGAITANVTNVAGYSNAASSPLSFTAGTATTAVSLSSSATDVIAGSPVTFTGTATKTYNGTTTPANRVPVRLIMQPASGPQVLLASTSVPTSGNFTVRGVPKVSGTVTAQISAGTGYAAATSAPLTLTAGVASTAVTMSSSAASVSAGTPVLFSGRVTKTYNGVTSNGTGLVVRVYLQPTSGGAQILLGSGYVNSLGNYSIRGYPRVSGTVTAQVVAKLGYLPSASPTGTVAVV